MGDTDATENRDAGAEAVGPPDLLPDRPPPKERRTPPDPVTLSSPTFDAEGRLCWAAPPGPAR